MHNEKKLMIVKKDLNQYFAEFNSQTKYYFEHGFKNIPVVGEWIVATGKKVRGIPHTIYINTFQKVDIKWEYQIQGVNNSNAMEIYEFATAMGLKKLNFNSLVEDLYNAKYFSVYNQPYASIEQLHEIVDNSKLISKEKKEEYKEKFKENQKLKENKEKLEQIKNNIENLIIEKMREKQMMKVNKLDDFKYIIDIYNNIFEEYGLKGDIYNDGLMSITQFNESEKHPFHFQLNFNQNKYGAKTKLWIKCSPDDFALIDGINLINQKNENFSYHNIHRSSKYNLPFHFLAFKTAEKNGRNKEQVKKEWEERLQKEKNNYQRTKMYNEFRADAHIHGSFRNN